MTSTGFTPRLPASPPFLMSEDEVVQYQRSLRAYMLRTLDDVLLPDEQYSRFREQVMEDGARVWARLLNRLCGSNTEAAERVLSEVGLGILAASRVVGFGFHQARALARQLGIPSQAEERASHLGALFNLGIVLFDLVCDRHPRLAKSLFSMVSPGSLNEALCGGDLAPLDFDDPALRLLRAIILFLFKELETCDAAISVRQEFRRTIARMHEAEMALTQKKRSVDPPDRMLWRHMRAKSALPMWTIALVVLHFNGRDAPLDRIRPSVARIGFLLWIVDDLADAGEDFGADSWSRVWYLMAKASAEPTLDSIFRSGIVARETKLLAHILRRIPERTSAATVQSWVYGLPS